MSASIVSYLEQNASNTDACPLKMLYDLEICV